MSKKLKIGISSCLAGENVRFDGGHRKDSLLLEELGKCFEFESFCPEVAIGMGVPRQTIRLVEMKGNIEALGVKDPALNVTKELKQIALDKSDWIRNLSGYIVKKSSPSCGMERVKVYGQKMVTATGRGIFTEQLMQQYPLFPIEEEGRLKNPVLLDSFIQRVYAYSRWQEMSNTGLTPYMLINFHTQYKMVLLSRNQQNYRIMGRMVASVTKNNIKSLSQQYIQLFMDTLKMPATRNGHVNVLQHLQGFLKRQLPKDEKQNLSFIVEKYGKGELPLIAPKVLLNMYFSKHRHEFVDKSLYLKPYPLEIGVYTKL